MKQLFCETVPDDEMVPFVTVSMATRLVLKQRNIKQDNSNRYGTESEREMILSEWTVWSDKTITAI